jgi:chromosome segregation ATPase
LSQERLRQVNGKLAQENGATQQQRDEYDRLAEKQRDLEGRLAAASAEPSPKDPAGIAAQKERFDRMTQEKDVLERQINALQRAL